MTKESRRSLAQIDRAMAELETDVKSGRISKTRARAMRQVAKLIREVVALEKRAGGSFSVFSLKRLPKAQPRRAGKRRRRKA
jgi:hypothetical protein